MWLSIERSGVIRDLTCMHMYEGGFLPFKMMKKYIYLNFNSKKNYN
jgi:hypothetical protein